MSLSPRSMARLLREDRRYKLDAYLFVYDALNYAHDVLEMGSEMESESESARLESHLTGQQLCEAFRLYALEQYGYLAKTVVNSWGIYSTSDIGEVVYNLIRIGEMKKSSADRREDFDDVFDFEDGFCRRFEISMPRT